jgi:hypothetical protein
MYQPRYDPQHLRNLLQQRRKNLQQLEVQEAKHGNQAPLAILNALEDERAAIAALEAQLAQEEAAIASTLGATLRFALPAEFHNNQANDLVTLLALLYCGALSQFEGQQRVSQASALAPLLNALLSHAVVAEGARIALHTGSPPGDIHLSLASDGAGSNLIQITIPVTGEFGASYYHYRTGAQPPAGTDALAHPVVLPPDQVPAVAPLPPNSHMPMKPNPVFVGRREDLRAIAAALMPAGDRTIVPEPIVAITGMGGVGKTQLACEFVYCYGQYFPGGVFWVNFADVNDIRSALATGGSSGPRLLVFDNCEDPASLAKWRPPEGSGARVLLTSRRTDWDPTLGVTQQPLWVLSRSESIQLIIHYRPDLRTDDSSLDAVCATLGDLPLALHLSGSYLRACGSTFGAADYLDDLPGTALLEHESLQEGEGINAPTDHILNVGRTFALSYELLDPLNPRDALALALLQRASYFAQSEPIATGRLLATLPPDANPRLALRSQAVQRLISLGLLEKVDERHVHMHRLLTMFVQQRDSDHAARLAVSQHLREAVVDPSLPIASRRTAAFQLLRIHGLTDGPPVATEELLACLDLVARFVVAPAHHYALIKAISAHLGISQTGLDQRLLIRLLVYRAMLWGKLGDLEDEQQAAKSLQLATDEYAVVRPLNAAILRSGNALPEDWQTAARISLGEANLTMRQYEDLSDSADPAIKKRLLRQSIVLYRKAAQEAHHYRQDIVLEVAIFKELSYGYACQGLWGQAVRHYTQALDMLAHNKDRIDPQAYVRQLAWILETASEVHLAKGRRQPKGAHSQQAYRDYLQAYSLTQHEIALLQQAPQQMKSLVLACYNAGTYLLEMHRCPDCHIPQPLEEAYAFWKSAQELAHRLGMLEWERKLGRSIEQLRRDRESK